MSVEQDTVTDQVVEFGDEQNLVAIVSEPAQPRSVPSILILNAGVLHRVGPHRLHVRLARRLAAQGHRVARMDLSGIGDSRALPGRMSFRESAVADIRTVLDSLAGDDSNAVFILFGICSGADNALAAAQADSRIRGLVLVDPPAYTSKNASLRRAAHRAGSVSGWMALPMRIGRMLRNRLSRIFLGGSQAGLAEAPVGGREMPPIEAYRKQLGQLVGQGVGILAIYSGVLGTRYNHQDQLFEWFPELRGRIECAYFPAANHTFTELSAQAALESLVLRWCDENSVGAGTAA